MRQTLLALLAAIAVLTGSLVLGSGRADAMMAAPALGGASQSISPVEKAACWRWGWHGWGWYPCFYGYGYYGYGYGYPGYWGGPYYRFGWGPGWHRGYYYGRRW